MVTLSVIAAVLVGLVLLDLAVNVMSTPKQQNTSTEIEYGQDNATLKIVVDGTMSDLERTTTINHVVDSVLRRNSDLIRIRTLEVITDYTMESTTIYVELGYK